MDPGFSHKEVPSMDGGAGARLQGGEEEGAGELRGGEAGWAVKGKKRRGWGWDR